MGGKIVFIPCEKCGKKLIERLPNGLWVFKFGKRDGSEPVVDIVIHGSLSMRCLRRTCRHLNVLNYFPSGSQPLESSIGTGKVGEKLKN